MASQNKIQERLQKVKAIRNGLVVELLNLEEEGRKLRRDVSKVLDKTKQAKVMKFIAKQS